MLDLIGHRLGNYEIFEWLGDSAHVHAYLARDSSTGEDVVVKILKSHLAGTAAFHQRFEAEVKAAMALNHPNIVKILRYCKEGDALFLVQTYQPADSLRQLFDKNPGPLPLDRVTRTLLQIASALDYAHQHGIIHRDLKPGNVLYDLEGNAQLADLGITKTLDPDDLKSQSNIEFGNPNYLSPEVWQGKPAGPYTDIYALGIILFQMLTGEFPFNSVMPASRLYLHLMHVVSQPKSLHALRPDLPPGIESVIARAIEKDPARRYATAGELAQAFQEALRS